MERRPLTHPPGAEQSPGSTADVVRLLKRRGLQLLPGAVVLFAFQMFVARTGALRHVQPNEQAVLAVSLVSVILSIALLAIVVFGRDVAEDDQSGMRRAELTTALLLAGIGALAGSLAGDYFVIGSRLTGSNGVGGVAGAMVLLLICVPSL